MQDQHLNDLKLSNYKNCYVLQQFNKKEKGKLSFDNKNFDKLNKDSKKGIKVD